MGGPVIDQIPNVSIPAGKSLTLPITASSTNGRPLTYTVTSSTNRVTVEVHTNNPFWKFSVVQRAASNAPGAYLTPFRGGLAMVTNVGDMTLLLLRDRAPRTVDVFQGLTMAGYFNSNTIFHRVIPNFMIQGGDPATNGSGGPIFRYDDELHARAIFSGYGQLAMANSGKDVDGSQFFITQSSPRHLDFNHTVFGQLLRGFNVLTNIIFTPRVDTNITDRPIRDVIITRASFVTNHTDTAITLTGTNLAGVVATIRVIADDGVGGRVTNTFTATTVSDAANNNHPILPSPAITNLFVPVNGRLTNWISSFDIENSARYYDAYWSDLDFFGNSHSRSNSSFAKFPTNNAQFVFVPNSNYFGPLKIYVAVAQDPAFSSYDFQAYTVAVGDTPITAFATNLFARAGVTISNLVAWFTNGVPNSATTNFVAAINWGDNSTNNGSMTTNLNGWKEVRRAHTYTNAGTYPITIRVRSNRGAETTVFSTAYVSPALSFARTGATNILRWPAWAADYLPQSHTNLSTSDWATLTNLPVLIGYENVLTNTSTTTNAFFRLRR
jgi:cyclophilin family peptidyl-prolyl cis-trans isomerase